MNPFSLIAALLAGVSNPVHSGMNATLKKSLGEPQHAVFMNFAVGLVAAIAYAVATRVAWPGGERVASAPWWAWMGGLLAAYYALVATSLADKMGSGTFIAVTVTAQLVCSVALDHFGLVGFEKKPAGLLRLVGLGLMVGGVLLVARK